MGTIVILTGGDRAVPLAGFAGDMKRELADMAPLLKEVTERVIQPAFGRNYDRSGLQKGSDCLKQALTKTGAKGNLLKISGQSITAGVDSAAVPHFKWAIGGRGEVRPKNRRALMFDANGKVVFTKHSKPAPAHDVVYLTDADFERAAAVLTELLVANGGYRLPK